MEKGQETKYLKIILGAVIVLNLIIIAYRIGSPINYDESMNVMSVRDNAFFNYYNYNGGPMLMYLLFPAKYLLGIDAVSMRLVPIIFGILSAVMVYAITKRFLSSQNKNVAIYSLILLGTCGGMVLNSLSLHTDGSILMFFMLCSTYCFLRSEEKQINTKQNKEQNKKQNYWLALTGIFVALACLTKYSGVLILFAIMLYYIMIYVMMKKPLGIGVKNFMIVLLCFLAVFSIYPASTYIYNKEYYESVTAVSLKHSFSVGGNLLCKAGVGSCEVDFTHSIKPGIIHYAHGGLKSVLVTSPLLIILSMIAFLGFAGASYHNKKKEMDMHNRTLLFLFLCIIIYFGFMLLLVNPLLDNFRYLQFSTGFLAIVAGTFIAGLNYEQKKKILIFGICLFGVLTLLSINNSIIKFTSDNAGQIISNLGKANLSFYLPINLGPTFTPALFYSMWAVMMIIIVICATAGMTAYLAWQLFRNKNKSYDSQKTGAGLIILIILAAGTHLYIFSENGFNTTTPDLTQVKKQMIIELLNQNLPEPILVNDAPIGYALGAKYPYLDPTYEKTFINGRINITEGLGAGPNYLPKESAADNKFVKEKISRAKTIILFDETFTPETKKMVELVSQQCKTIKEYKTKGRIAGYWFECNK